MTPAEIEQTVLGAFGYLLHDYGFNYVSTSVRAPECWSTFHNATTAVTVHYEIGSVPWVELAELKREGGRLLELNRSSLEFLVLERAPDQAGQLTGVTNSDEGTRGVIQEKARLLREYGEDVLRGNFQIFPRLKELALENLRRRNAAE